MGKEDSSLDYKCSGRVCNLVLDSRNSGGRILELVTSKEDVLRLGLLLQPYLNASVCLKLVHGYKCDFPV